MPDQPLEYRRLESPKPPRTRVWLVILLILAIPILILALILFMLEFGIVEPN